MDCQRHLFSLPEEVAYLNNAYMAPNLKLVEAAGIKGIARKNRPYEVVKEDFFEPLLEVKKLFADLISMDDPERIAIIPSVSYGIATLTRNIKPKPYGNIVVAAEQFPSNYYGWKRYADTFDLQIRTVRPPEVGLVGQAWNESILESIDNQTVLVALGQVHWADGTLFNLEAIREKTRQHHAFLIVDGTQSVGAFPFDQSKIQADALICAGYKWLLGPYSLGLAYYGPAFDEGIPIEENWINRLGSDNFQGLVNYENKYLPKARRFSMGECSNFILLPMLTEALHQVNTWGSRSIQQYASRISAPYIEHMKSSGILIEDEIYRGSHLFGLRLPNHIDQEQLRMEFEKEKVFVSYRGNAIRVSLHVYNREEDLQKLVYCIEKSKI